MKIGEFIRARQAEGLSDRDILPLVYREFSGAKTTLNSIRWYRWKDKEEVACVPRAQGDVMTLVANERAEEAGPVNSIGIEYSVLKKEGVESLISFKTAQEIADELRQYLQQTEIQEQIRVRHVLGASSMSIQELVLRKALELGFEDEKMGLFANNGVPGLRPDYYCRVDNTGILLEVERGKTTSNNMDLLDLWKCHICEHAEYLFLLVPQARPSANGTVLRHFRYVQKRLAVFFEPKNYVNVSAVHLFGY
jgi:hypothetical protein